MAHGEINSTILLKRDPSYTKRLNTALEYG